MESIKEMREICQVSRQSAIYQMNWFDYNVLRRISIYLAKFCIKVKWTANSITLVDFLFVLASGVCFISPQPHFWFLGLVLFYLYLQIDCVDGEVARYNEYKGTRAPQPLGKGSFLGGVVDAFVWPYVFACMSFGLFAATGNLLSFAFGFTAVIMRSLYMDLGLIVYPILHDYDKLATVRKSTETLGEAKILSLGRMAFGIQGFLPMLLICILVDWIFVLPISFRLMYVALFGFGATVGVLLKVRDTAKHGVRIQRI